MQISFLITYLLTVLIATITPGPGMLLAFNHGLRFGVKKSLITAWGVTIAAFLQASITLAGLGAALIQSEKIYYLIKVSGALYLIYIGLKTFFIRTHEISEEMSIQVQQKSSFELFRDSFLIGVGNPKAIVFFTALFPQFICNDSNQNVQYGIMVISVTIITFLCMVLYSFFGAKLIDLFKKRTVQAIFNRVTGGIFISLGVAIAVEK